MQHTIKSNRSIVLNRTVKIHALLARKFVTKTATNYGISPTYRGMQIGASRAERTIVLDELRRRDLSRWSEKSRLSTLSRYANCDDVVTLETKYSRVNILWHVCDIMRGLDVWTRVASTIAGPQCSKVYRALSASATTRRCLDTHSRHLLFNHCDPTMRPDVFLMFAYGSFIICNETYSDVIGVPRF